jgi:glycosyltransferase involved in cell wall biosynthesis
VDLAGFDVVHFHGDNQHRPRTSPPVVRTIHGSCFSEAIHIRGLKERVRMFALGVTEVIGSLRAVENVAVSRNTTRWYPWVRRVIPNGVDLDRFHPGEKEPEPVVMFVGTYESRKRGRLLMEAFERVVLPAMPDARLWMVCSDAPPARNVEVLGRLDDGELADRYRRAWVFCLPSSYEGFGVPYIEAMASGTAVVATPNPGAIEVLGRGRFGLLTKPRDLGASLLEVLTDDGRRRSLGESGLQRSRDFDWLSVAEAYEGVYESALRRAARRRGTRTSVS